MRDAAQPIHIAPPAPQHLEAEQALLGAILVNNDAYERVSGFLEGQHFFDPMHQRLYEVAGKLIAEGTGWRTGAPIPASCRTCSATATPSTPRTTPGSRLRASRG
jgi:replicative DNA helicase